MNFNIQPFNFDPAGSPCFFRPINTDDQVEQNTEFDTVSSVISSVDQPSKTVLGIDGSDFTVLEIEELLIAELPHSLAERYDQNFNNGISFEYIDFSQVSYEVLEQTVELIVFYKPESVYFCGCHNFEVFEILLRKAKILNVGESTTAHLAGVISKREIDENEDPNNPKRRRLITFENSDAPTGIPIFEEASQLYQQRLYQIQQQTLLHSTSHQE